jgi:hypothetical protein
MLAHSAFLTLALCGAGETALLDFRADWCGPCRQMDPVVERLAAAGWPVKRVDIDAYPDLAARYQVQAVPCFVLVVGGREVERLEGVRSQAELLGMFRRAGLDRPAAAAARGTRRPPPRAGSAESGNALPAAAVSRGQSPDSSQPPSTAAIGQPAAAHADLKRPTRTRPHRRLIERLLAATVRLRIDDGDGRSVGTGTIIDARSGEALVLTCGHLFRTSRGKGGVRIDTFGPGAASGLRGRLLHYDLERDLALVTFRPVGRVTTARLAPADYQLRVGDAVVNIGCDHGDDPTAISSTITSIDKFLGPPNVQVAGQPVQGRSGGGLFTADGLVIGVCNAADPADDEGLYAALRSIHDQLDELGLLEMIAGGRGTEAPPHLPAQMPQAAPPARSTVVPTSDEKEEPSVASAGRSGRLPGETPDLGQPERTADSERAPGPHVATGAGLSAEERAVLEELGRRADTAEVICIVRPRGGGRSEIIVLEEASAAFFEKLAAASAGDP